MRTKTRLLIFALFVVCSLTALVIAEDTTTGTTLKNNLSISKISIVQTEWDGEIKVAIEFKGYTKDEIAAIWKASLPKGVPSNLPIPMKEGIDGIIYLNYMDKTLAEKMIKDIVGAMEKIDMETIRPTTTTQPTPPTPKDTSDVGKVYDFKDGVLK